MRAGARSGRNRTGGPDSAAERTRLGRFPRHGRRTRSREARRMRGADPATPAPVEAAARARGVEAYSATFLRAGLACRPRAGGAKAARRQQPDGACRTGRSTPTPTIRGATVTSRDPAPRDRHRCDPRRGRGPLNSGPRLGRSFRRLPQRGPRPRRHRCSGSARTRHPARRHMRRRQREHRCGLPQCSTLSRNASAVSEPDWPSQNNAFCLTSRG